MVLVPVSELPVDRSLWRPLGMHASGSHIVTFDGVEVDDDWLLGRPTMSSKNRALRAAPCGLPRCTSAECTRCSLL